MKILGKDIEKHSLIYKIITNFAPQKQFWWVLLICLNLFMTYFGTYLLPKAKDDSQLWFMFIRIKMQRKINITPLIFN